MNFETIKFLEPFEINQALSSVEKLKDYWKHRGPNLIEEIPFYTLGAAEYMDLEEVSQEYYEKYAQEMNPILWNEFEWLYIKVKKFFEHRYQFEFEYYKEKAALPGFHIFLDNDFFEIAVAARHCDLQFRKINWNGMEYEFNSQLSFTLYLDVPKTGAGINSWDFYYHELKDLDCKSREDKLNSGFTTYNQFKKGEMVLHDGFQYHQIAPIEQVFPGDRRISLQGHAIKANGTYWFHW